jgi:V/A-type H+-transporting ATPase subunit I
MIQLLAVVLRKDCQRVTEALLREGVMQFISTSEIGGGKPGDLSAVKPETSLTEVSDLRKRTEGLLHTIGIIPSPPGEKDLNNRVAVDLEKEKAHLDKIDGERASIRERQRTIQDEILKLEDIRRQVGLYGIGLSDVTLPAKHSFISMQTGKLLMSNVSKLEDGLKDLPSLEIALGREGDMVHYMLISMKRDSEQIQKVLANSGWAEIELPEELKSVKEDTFKELSAKLKTLTDEQKKLETEAYNIVNKQEKHIRDAWVNLRVSELLNKIQINFVSSSRTVIFTGWLPSARRQRLTEIIQKASENRCYLEWIEADSRDMIGDEVPVRFNNPKVLAPFQMLVSNFGIPRYGTIDPTPFVMPLYLAMFGLMFADVGQGLILTVLGILGAYLLRTNSQKKAYHRLSWLIIWCGLSSTVFGALFGSYFGVSLKPLWFDFHGIVLGHGGDSSMVNDVSDILSITIYFGICVISLGLLFNWVNVIRAGRWMELFFDKGGIMGGWIYGGGVYIASYMISHDYKEFPPATVLFLLAGLPAILLFIKEPYHYLKHDRRLLDRKPNPIFVVLNFLMQWIVELLEIVGGYLSNTLSFMRVAGLGIAHVCLMISIFTLDEMTSGIISVLVIILGNIMVIALEGLSAGVQALRLSYYEFFTKFFHGTGKLYAPISLNSEL